MLKISTIGLGNAGSQVSQLAYELKNIPGLAINSSKQDLASITLPLRFAIGDEKGAGKNRDNAKAFLKAHIAELVKEADVVEHITSSDIVFVISSIGGGTGSGMAPMMVDILQKAFKNTKFILVGIYAPLRESLAAQQNSIDYLKEIREHNSTATIMAYDNNRYSDITTSEMMTKVNREIVEDLAVLRGDYQFTTPFNSIDEKDMMRILQTPGRLVVYRATGVREKDIDEKGLEDILLVKIVKDSAHAELDKDQVVKRLGIITNLTASADEKFDINIKNVKKYVGEPVEGFEHVHRLEKGDSNNVFLIMSGLSVPNDRIIKMTERIEEGIALLQQSTESVLDTLNTANIKSLREDVSSDADAGVDLDDIFGKY